MSIIIKSKEEIQKIKESSQILAEVKQIVFDAIRPGVSLKELDSIAFKETIKRGAKPAFLGYQGFPATICASLNEVLIHGIPNETKLQEGDIISIDMGVMYKGYFSDSAFTKGVGKISKEDQKLINVAKEAFNAGVNAIKPGARLGDVANAIGKVIRKNGYFTPDEFCGHGIGKNLHEEPYVFNEGPPGQGPLIRNGMVICIEPMIMQKNAKIKILKDGWTVVSLSGMKTSHYEHTILIEDGYPVILTGGI